MGDTPKFKGSWNMCLYHPYKQRVISYIIKERQVIKRGNLNDLLDSVVCTTDDELCMTGEWSVCRDKSIEYILGQDDEIKFFKWVRVTERRNIKGKEKNTTFTIKQPQTGNLSSMKTHFLKSLSI